MHSLHTPILRTIWTVVAATALALGLSTAGAAAHADTTAPSAVASAAARCVGEGKVFVVAVDDTGAVVGQGCADAPTTGNDALTKAGITYTLGSGSMVCTVAGVPASCPKTFAGQYWSYWTASQGKAFGYATAGSGQAKPVAGTIEGWCWTPKGDEKSQAADCLKFLTAAVDPAALSTASSPASSASPASPTAATSPAPTDQSSGMPSWVPVLVVSGLVVVAGLLLGLRQVRRTRG